MVAGNGNWKIADKKVRWDWKIADKNGEWKMINKK